jgi:Regulator of chromosome condensation (RCC1) repeat
MTTTKSYFLRPRVLLIAAALAASVMAVVLASPASTAQTTVQAGTPLAWGENCCGQTDVPSGLTDVVAVSGGSEHSLALKSNGTVVAWGDGTFGQTDVPSGLTGVVAVDAGAYHNLAVKQVAELGPTSTDDCENGGYKDFGFKNQGQCIKAVNRAR